MHPAYYAVLNRPHGPGHRVLVSADFTTLAPGGNVALPSGWTLTRASSGASVQTGTSTVVSSIAANLSRGGRRLTADPISLVFEHGTTNVTVQPRDISVSPWGYDGSAPPLFGTSPDGASLSRRQTIPSNTNGSSQVMTGLASGDYTCSLWEMAASGGADGAWYMITDDVGLVGAVGGALPVDWMRTDLTGHVSSVVVLNTCTGGGVDSVSPGNRDAVTDMCMTELGGFATEFDPATRSGERLFYAVGSDLVDRGRVSMDVLLQPKGAIAKYDTTRRLLTIDASNHVTFAPSTGVVTVTVAGVPYATPLGLAWARYDLVEIWCAFGGGIACDIQYRLNGGSANVLSTGSPTVFGNVVIPGSLDALCNGTTGQLTAWLRELDFYEAGSKPIGMA